MKLLNKHAKIKKIIRFNNNVKSFDKGNNAQVGFKKIFTAQLKLKTIDQRTKTKKLLD